MALITGDSTTDQRIAVLDRLVDIIMCVIMVARVYDYCPVVYFFTGFVKGKKRFL